MHGRFEASIISVSHIERGKEKIRVTREKAIRRKISKITNPPPDLDEWIVGTFSRFSIAKPWVDEINLRLHERIDAYIEMSLGSTLTPFERAAFLPEEEAFIANLSPRIRRYVDDTVFPPCPGCHVDQVNKPS